MYTEKGKFDLTWLKVHICIIQLRTYIRNYYNYFIYITISAYQCCLLGSKSHEFVAMGNELPQKLISNKGKAYLHTYIHMHIHTYVCMYLCKLRVG